MRKEGNSTIKIDEGEYFLSADCQIEYRGPNRVQIVQAQEGVVAVLSDGQRLHFPEIKNVQEFMRSVMTQTESKENESKPWNSMVIVGSRRESNVLREAGYSSRVIGAADPNRMQDIEG